MSRHQGDHQIMQTNRQTEARTRPEGADPMVRDVSAEQLGSALRRRWWAPLAGLVLGLGIALGLAASEPPQYESVTTMMVHAGADDDTAAERLAAEDLAISRTTTYESLGESLVVAEQARDELGTDASAGELLDGITVTATPATTGLQITAAAESPEEATDLADAWREAITSVASTSAEDAQVSIESVGEPTTPDEPSGLSRTTIGVMGAAVGLLVGIIAAVATTRPRTELR